MGEELAIRCPSVTRLLALMYLSLSSFAILCGILLGVPKSERPGFIFFIILWCFLVVRAPFVGVYVSHDEVKIVRYFKTVRIERIRVDKFNSAPADELFLLPPSVQELKVKLSRPRGGEVETGLLFTQGAMHKVLFQLNELVNGDILK